MAKNLEAKLKTALDETRLLLLGGQVLLGFQFQAFFQDGFATLPAAATYLSLTGVTLMVVSIAILVSPVMQHRLVEKGHVSHRLLRATTIFAAAGLVPLAGSLALATYVVIGRRYGVTTGAVSALVMSGACALFWFGIEAAVGWSKGGINMKEGVTSLSTKVEQLLTEARVIIPGGQALFGFQFIAMLTKGFDELPTTSQLVHTVALCLIALNVVVLMTPAALHRISFGGKDSQTFLNLGSMLVVSAPMLLALGIAAELYVVFDKVLQNDALSMIAGCAGWLVMTAFWYIIPIGMKERRSIMSVKTVP
jgi:hypothetical protein